MSVFEKARGSSLWIELPHALLSELAAAVSKICLLYTSDAADEEDSVELGGRRIIIKKKEEKKKISIVWW